MAKTGFNNLPLETVIQIFTSVDNDMDRLCLALTCRSLLNFLDKSKALRSSPRYRGFKNMSILQTGKLESERWTLLRKLEDSRWRCCFGCFKLHPAEEFSGRDLVTGSDKRMCVCGPLVGTVCLCPCMEITFRDKIKLVKLLSAKPERQDQKTKTKYFEDNGFRFERSNKALHKCSYLPKPTETDPFRTARAGLSCQVELFLEKDGNLMAETRYEITSNESPSQYLLNHDLLICPHRRLISQIYQIQRAHNAPGPTRKSVTEMKINGTWWKRSQYSIECSNCTTTICEPEWTFQKRKTANTVQTENVFIFETKRCLGKATEQADKVWYQQTENSRP